MSDHTQQGPRSVSLRFSEEGELETRMSSTSWVGVGEDSREPCLGVLPSLADPVPADPEPCSDPVEVDFPA